MEIVNLSAEDVLYGLESPKIYGLYEGDYYRKFTDYDKDSILALYYKKLLAVKDKKTLDMEISTRKWSINFEYTWEHYTMCRLFTLVNRLEEVYEDKLKATSSLKSPVITGIALYKNYPVGTLFPRKLLDYKTLGELADDLGFTAKDKKEIFMAARGAVSSLIKHHVYPTGIYINNIVVNPCDYSDIRLDGLDGPSVARVESDQYVRELKRHGGDLVKESWNKFDSI